MQILDRKGVQMAKRKSEKSSFVMHRIWRKSLKKLNAEEYREIMEAIFEYTETRIRPKFSDRLLDIVFDPIQEILDEDYESWLETCEKNRKKAEIRWNNRNADACRSMPEDATVCHSMPEDTTACFGIKNDAENADYDNDNDLYSVCNSLYTHAGAREEKNFECHLGAETKQESCFDCQKKNKGPFNANAQFLLKHPEGFEEWNRKTEELYTNWVKEQKARGQPYNQELFDYDWVN